MDRAPELIEQSLKAEAGGPAPMPVVLPARAPLMGRLGWTAFLVALIAVCAVAPLLNLAVPPASPFHLSDYGVALLGKIMCFAICALASA